MQNAVCLFVVDLTWPSWSTFWSAISAIGTLLTIGAIVHAASQLKFNTWIQIQEIWNDADQRKLRKAIFERRENNNNPRSRWWRRWQTNTVTDWTPKQLEDAKNVCGRMDEFARLVELFLKTNRKEIIEIWYIPISKLWDVLKDIVDKEWSNHPSKWDAFERLAKDCVKRRNKKKHD